MVTLFVLAPPTILTIGDFFDAFRRRGIGRARVIEAGVGHVVVEVPRRFVDSVQQLGEFLPVGLAFEVRPLAWWRCWFVGHQSVRQW